MGKGLGRAETRLLPESCCSARRGPTIPVQIPAATVPVSLAASASESLVRELLRPGPRRVGLRAGDEPLILGGSRSLVRSRAISRFAERSRRPHSEAQAAQSSASNAALAICTRARDASAAGKAVQRIDTARRRAAASNRSALRHRGDHAVGMSAIKNNDRARSGKAAGTA